MGGPKFNSQYHKRRVCGMNHEMEMERKRDEEHHRDALQEAHFSSAGAKHRERQRGLLKPTSGTTLNLQSFP